MSIMSIDITTEIEDMLSNGNPALIDLKNFRKAMDYIKEIVTDEQYTILKNKYQFLVHELDVGAYDAMVENWISDTDG